MTLVNVGMMIRISGFLAVASIIPMVVMLPLTLYLINYMTKRGLRAINQNAMMTDAVQEGIRLVDDRRIRFTIFIYQLFQ